MSKFEKFNFNTIEDLKGKIDELEVNINLTKDLEPLKKTVEVGNKVAPNSMAILPMEGCDSNLDGSPSELVYRRYERFAAGGAGLLWWEANAVVEEGRANPMQMMLTEDNKEEFVKLVRASKKSAAESLGSEHIPVNILQLTHSGRYSRPVDKAAPIIAQHDPLLDPRVGIDESYPVATDEYLDSLVEKYVKSAILAKEVGFDGVDVKACHRYLLSELLASHTREGKYGGSFENRTRLMVTIVKEIRKAVGEDFIIASRFNVFDYHPYPYGFGVDKEVYDKPDFTEPLQLVKLLCENGVDLLSNSAGNPYYIHPQVTRPFDLPIIGGNTPEEHPLESIARLFEFTRQIQQAAGDIPVVGNGYSWLREFIPYIGAANLLDSSCSFVGLGRQAFAYPDAPKDTFINGQMEHNKCCIACSKCTQIMRDHGRTGCVIKDATVYVPLFKEARENATK
jgi:2,4-dienoyl-CoA reductase (NADPH2)